MPVTTASSNAQSAQQFLRRLANSRSMSKLRMGENRRSEARVDFCMGIWVIPLAHGSPDLRRAFPAITRDLSSLGLGIVADRPLLNEEHFLCFPLASGMKFLRARAESQRDVGAGWCLVGVEIVELLRMEDHPRLIQFAASILLG